MNPMIITSLENFSKIEKIFKNGKNLNLGEMSQE